MYSHSIRTPIFYGVQSVRIVRNISKSIIKNMVRSPKRLMIFVSVIALLYVMLTGDMLPLKPKRKTTKELKIEGPFPWWDDDNLSQCKQFMELKKKNDKITADVLNWDEGTYSYDRQVSVSHCGVRAFLRGYEQNVISYALFESRHLYNSGLPDILADVSKMYLGYSVRVHTDPRGKQELLCPLLLEFDGQLDICDVLNLPPPFGNITDARNAMYYRLIPYGDYQVSRLLVRHLDSKLFNRDLAAVQQWIRSGKLFHIMRDNPIHRKIEIVASTHSIYQPNQTTADLFSLIRTKIFRSTDPGDDSEVLRCIIPKSMYIDNALQHDAYDCVNHPEAVPYPTQREGTEFAGNEFYQFGEYQRALLCPPECRPENHQEWWFC